MWFFIPIVQFDFPASIFDFHFVRSIEFEREILHVLRLHVSGAAEMMLTNNFATYNNPYLRSFVFGWFQSDADLLNKVS